MADAWEAFDLEVEAIDFFESFFSPVAHVQSYFETSAKDGAGFLIHPRILITAAHVVTFNGYGTVNAPGRVRLDFGDQLCSAEAIAIPSRWLNDSDPWLDFAIMRLDHDVCPAAVTFVLDVLGEAATATADILGFGGRSLPVKAQRPIGAPGLAYPLANSPGYSGSPISTGTFNGQPIAVGLHTRQTHADGLGHGVMPTDAQVRAALQLLGFPT